MQPLIEALLREEAGGYSFTHALIQQTVLEELSLPRRQRLHLEVAEAIERVHAGNLASQVAALANHYTRYNLILIGPFSAAAAWFISERARRRTALTPAPPRRP